MLAFAVAGCSTTGRHVQWYPGPPLSTNETALLKIQRDFGGVNVPVNKINGEPLTKGKKGVGNTAKEIALLPGTYELSISYFCPGPNGDSQSTSDVLITLSAEAGKIYQLRAAHEEITFGKSLELELVGGKYAWTAWILDTGTGKVVAGRPREKPLHWYEK